MLPSVPVDIHRMPTKGKHSKVGYPIQVLYIISFKFHDYIYIYIYILLMVCKLYVSLVVINPLVKLLL